MNKNIIIFGGDGFCGWPLSLRLSKLGYNVIIVDNLCRRNIDKELKTSSLTPIKDIHTRVKTWNKINKNKIKFYNINILTELDKIKKLFIKYKPFTVYMLAELKSAPYSMMSLRNGNMNFGNIISNNNLLYIISRYSKNTHFIHLGTMGVYGYDLSKKKLPEGYFKAKLYYDKTNYEFKKILHPASPGSIYHLTKAQDELLFQFYNKIYNLKITDLHQGIVWGCNTSETIMHKNLVNRFDYDHIYGTFINRIIVQSSINHPLIIHGTGNQLRPIININNAIESFVFALKIKTFKEVNIINEFGEILRLKTIANYLAKKYSVKIKNIKNPRVENENNTLKAEPQKLLSLGLKINKLSKSDIHNLFKLAKKYKKNVIKDKIINSIHWNSKKIK